MEIKGRSGNKGQVTLHSNDATFCAVDAQPSELFSKPNSDDVIASYTGVIIPQPEYFNEFR